MEELVNKMRAEHFGLWIEMIQRDPELAEELRQFHMAVENSCGHFAEHLAEIEDRRWCAEERAENEEFGRL